MTSEDWTKVLLALIATGGAVLTAAIGLGAAWLKWKLDKGEKLMNGRLDQLLQSTREKFYAAGHRDGRAGLCEAIAESPKFGPDAQGMAEVMSQTAVPKEKQ